MKIKILLLITLLISILNTAVASDIVLNCSGLRHRCFTKKGIQFCFDNIELKICNEKNSILSYKKIYPQLNVQDNMVIDNQQSFYLKLTDYDDGIFSVWDNGEYWAKLLKTAHNEYVGTISFEFSYPVTVLCK